MDFGAREPYPPLPPCMEAVSSCEHLFPPSPIPVTFGRWDIYQGTVSSALSCGTRRVMSRLGGLWALLMAGNGEGGT